MDFLRSSRKGRSRFSKALPTPPPPEPDSLPKSRQLPSIPPVLPALFEKKPAMSDKPLPPPQPLDQSLPSLPSLQTKALPLVHIPRRPVAKNPAPPQSQSPEDERNSIGSLLSAYSRSSGESLIMSPDGSASQRDSNPAYGSERYGTKEANILTPNSVSSGDNELPHPYYGTQNFTSDKGLPYAPAKTGHAPTVGSPTSIASGPSSQRPIWRRRSVKSDRNMEVTDLKLADSHGSTAASQPNTAQTSHSAVPPPAQQRFPPRSTSNLPGRNIRPVPPQNQVPTADNMGQETSRLKEKIARMRGGEEGTNPGVSHSDTALSPTQRLPTPDYEKEDVKTPVVNTVVSPVSPASSPEPGRDQASNEAKPPIPRKAVTARNLHVAHSQPQLRVDEPITNSEAPPTVTRDFAVSPVSPDPQNQFRPRAASNQHQQPQQHQQHQQQQQQQQRGQWQQPGREYMPNAPAPAFAQGDMRPASKDQRHEPVEYRELSVKDLPPADPRASFFPIHDSEPPSPGMVYKALPLKESMLDCYVKHRVMDRTRNRNYALTCQTCGKADTEDRFKCQWCYVRMCASCLQIFNGNRRDLRKLLSHLEGNPQSGGSQERPATAAGIEPTEAGMEDRQAEEQQVQPQMVAA